MDSGFEIVTPESVHETILENMVILWKPTIKIVPPISSQNSFPYIASGKHVGGFGVGNPCEWCLQLNPYYTEDGKRYISLFLWVHKFLRKDKPVQKQSVHAMYEFRVDFCCGQYQTVFKFSSIHKFTEKKSCYGFKKFMAFPRPYDLGPAVDVNLLSMDLYIKASIMIIRDIEDFVFPCTIEDKCGLLISNGNSGESSSPVIEEEDNEKRSELFFVNHAIKNKVSEMRKTGKIADVIIRSQQKKHIAHMSVLLARCKSKKIPVQLETIRGKEMKIIDLKTFQDCSVSAVLDFCYDDYSKLFTTYKKIISIFIIASDLNLDTLQNQCMIEFARCVTPKYFFHTLKMILTRPTFPDDKGLRDSIISYMGQYYIKNHVQIRDLLPTKTPKTREEAQLLIAMLFLC